MIRHLLRIGFDSKAGHNFEYYSINIQFDLVKHDLFDLEFYRHSLHLGEGGSSKFYLFVCLHVCPAFTAYISIAIGRILN